MLVYMRLTVHLPDDLARLLKQTALNEGKSMSALTAEALDFYLRERRRRALGLKVLERAGKAQVAPKALEALEEGIWMAFPSEPLMGLRKRP